MTASQSLPIGRQSLPAGLAALVEKFAPITLKEMDAVALLNRIDTKFVHDQRGSCWHALAPFNLITGSCRSMASGSTITARCISIPRILICTTCMSMDAPSATRCAAASTPIRAMSFLEVKHKTRKDRTIKERIPTAAAGGADDPGRRRLAAGCLPLRQRQLLEPKLWNTFTRITLVSKQIVRAGDPGCRPDVFYRATGRSTWMVMADCRSENGSGQPVAHLFWRRCAPRKFIQRGFQQILHRGFHAVRPGQEKCIETKVVVD